MEEQTDRQTDRQTTFRLYLVLSVCQPTNGSRLKCYEIKRHEYGHWLLFKCGVKTTSEHAFLMQTLVRFCIKAFYKLGFWLFD